MSNDMFNIALLRIHPSHDLTTIQDQIIQNAVKHSAGLATDGLLVYKRIYDTAGPEGLELPEEMTQSQDNAFPWPGYDVAVFYRNADHADVYEQGFAEDTFDLLHTYTAEKKIALDKDGITSGQPSNGISYLYGLYFYDDLAPSAIERMWSNHPETVERVHIGVSRYTQWWIKSSAPGAPEIGGIAELHFPTEQDLVDRLFDSERGQKEVITDQKGFIARGMPRIFAKQYVV